jgi:hypothetical protein
MFLTFGGLIYLSVVLLEYFGRFSSSIRAVLLYTFIGVALFLFVRYILIPLFKLFNFGQTITHEQASGIIGKHFPDVDDRLLNTLQLHNDYNTGSQSELLSATIEQRAEGLSVVPFSNAVDITDNKKYLIFLLPILLVFGILLVSKPTVVTSSTDRLVNYTEEFIIEAPFQFNIDETKLFVVEGEDFDLSVKLKGNDIPEKVFVKSSDGNFLLNKEAKSDFSYEFIAVKENLSFTVNGAGFSSKNYELVVLKKPELTGMNVSLKFPKYLNRKDELIENAGDFTVPEGTVAEWKLFTRKTDNVNVVFKDTSYRENDILSDVIQFNRLIDSSELYQIALSRNDNAIIDSSEFEVQIIKDQYPTISVTQELDTTSVMNRFFTGLVADDYGLTSVSFHYTITKKDGSKVSKSRSVSANTKFNKSTFFDHIDLSTLGLQLEDKLTYYFVVRDNDAIHNYKSSRSHTFYYTVPSSIDLADKNNEDKDKIKEDIDKTIKKAIDFKKKIADLKLNSLQKPTFDWKDKQKIDELINDQKNLENKLNEINQQIQNNQQEQDEFNEQSEELKEKQEQIKELMENLMDDELKDLLEELKKLMEGQQKDAFDEKMEDLEMDSKELEEKLDNSLELLKRMEVEEKTEQIAENLKKLADDQKKLSEDVKNKEIEKEKALEKQTEIEKKFDQVKDDLKRLKEKNDALKDPMKLDSQDELKKDVDEKMDESKESLDKNQKKKASESQKEAGEKMDEMAQNMQMQMASQQEEQAEEDMQAMRMLLENIVTLSLDQESLMSSFDGLSKNNPVYVQNGPKQQKIKRDMQMVEDSLRALASRVPQIASFIDGELREVNGSIKKSLSEFEERKTASMNVAQQRVMTGLNNLALLLNEALEQMQQQSQQSKPGSGSCSKPGGKGSKPSSGMSMEQMKEMLKKQLDQMKKGANPGGKKPGDKPGDKPGEGGAGMGMGNKQISQMAREQSQLRKELKKLAQQLNKDGSGKGNGLNKAISELEKMEKDLVNKKFSSSMIQRQKEILSRLLESEKAVREQEYDNKRKSKSGQNQNNSNLILLKRYKENKQKEIELLKSVPPSLNEYYKNKANEYINVLDE